MDENGPSRDDMIPSPSSLEVNLDNVVDDLQEQIDNIPRAKKYVHFSHLEIQEYNITIGDNPWCSDGPPIALDWDYNKLNPIDIDMYEVTRSKRKNRKQMILNRYQRRDKLWKFGYALQDIEKASKQVDIDRRRKNMVIMCLPILRLEEVITLGSSRVREGLANGVGRCRPRKKRQTIDDPKEMSPTSPSKHDDDDKESFVTNDIETCAVTNDDDTLSHQSLSQRSPSQRQNSWSCVTWQNIRQRQSSDLSTLADTSSSTIHSSPTTTTTTTPTSLYPTYHVSIDPHQQDKSTEIILLQSSRPHMRAFHASWLSFFVAFFAWFSCTPLLSVMRRTLSLSQSDIWTSSLCSATSTILARIVMGPACDKFGARLCIATVLLFCALPVAATGAVRSGADLCIVRAFVGVAGSGFVACQCWTSRMFAREVAGTANALVAGWGNVGGGVAQLVMGSVLFPMGKVIYGTEEMAWRTVFVFPSVLCLVVAVFCVFFTDDCPKGDYRKRVKTNEIIIVDPCTSLCSAFTNWNVWILAIQYACCFGVEIAMTNAAPLYFEEEFDLSTEAAAAVASIFGFMNLFARGFGGFGSDRLNAKYGMTGRLTWQFVTLLVQAGGIVAFALARDLASAIVALVFCSLFVQSAEGSTFGIVPYVDRRYTGAVTGYVGAGGSVGGVLFAVFFREYAYKKAFVSMAIAAGMSSFLCLVMNVKMLRRLAGETYELVGNKSY